MPHAAKQTPRSYLPAQQRRSRLLGTASSPRPAVYVMGILAAFWCYERLALWLA